MTEGRSSDDQRQLDAEGAALAGGAVDGDQPSVRLDDGSDDAQAETGAGDVALLGLRPSKELAKQPSNLLRGNGFPRRTILSKPASGCI